MTITREHQALRAIGYNRHCTVEHANATSSPPAVERLASQGLIARDDEWTGCLVLTAAGNQRLDDLDELDQ